MGGERMLLRKAIVRTIESWTRKHSTCGASSSSSIGASLWLKLSARPSDSWRTISGRLERSLPSSGKPVISPEGKDEYTILHSALGDA
jgi:hypothetical protein